MAKTGAGHTAGVMDLWRRSDRQNAGRAGREAALTNEPETKVPAAGSLQLSAHACPNEAADNHLSCACPGEEPARPVCEECAPAQEQTGKHVIPSESQRVEAGSTPR